MSWKRFGQERSLVLNTVRSCRLKRAHASDMLWSLNTCTRFDMFWAQPSEVIRPEARGMSITRFCSQFRQYTGYLWDCGVLEMRSGILVLVEVFAPIEVV